MENVLPPESGLVVNGLIYRYSVEKDPSSDLQVTIQNEYSMGEGYIIQHTDDWSQLPGNTINKMLSFGNIPREYIGNGEVSINGEGTISNSYIAYSYRYDECYIVLSNPSCPGYDRALYDWLKNNGLLDKGPDVNDPFYDEWVQLTLNREVEIDTENENVDLKDIKDEEEDSGIAALNADVDIEGFVDGAAQAAIIQSYSTIPKFDSYYTTTIAGGVYEDVLVLDDRELQDNSDVLSNLTEDRLHRDMVRSQYENN